jgi:hypothetical protein
MHICCSYRLIMPQPIVMIESHCSDVVYVINYDGFVSHLIESDH